MDDFTILRQGYAWHGTKIAKTAKPKTFFTRG
jgi:hypothetical protein